MTHYKKVMRTGLGLDIRCIKRSKKRDKKPYYNILSTFDIEVTNHDLPPLKEGDKNGAGIVYLWVFAIDEIVTCYGRTIEEFAEFLEWVNVELEATLVVYVHNLSYEWQFIRKLFEWEHVFLVKRRKPITATTDNIEFRCSYMLAHKSLKKFLEDSGTKLQKLEYDYDIKRYPWEALTEEEYRYCEVDCIGLIEALKKLLSLDNDDVTTVPLTSTGYVRRDLRNSQSNGEKRFIKNISELSTSIYTAMKSCFVGGNTHANRFYTGDILDNIYCYDIASSYPNVQLTRRFPVRQFKKSTLKHPSKMLKKNAYMMKLHVTGARLKDIFDPMPVISISKCEGLKNYTKDNGRVLEAAEFTIWVTDVEYRTIISHYIFDTITIVEAYESLYGYLPDGVKACICKYYRLKCELKGIDDYNYKRIKEKLNSIYGMSAYDVAKLRYIYENDEYLLEDKSISDLIEIFNGQRTPPPEPYSWGVWTTAWARHDLNEVILIAGDRFVYCDTDSVYTFGELEEVESVNVDKIKASEPYKVTVNGRVYYIGIWELDKVCEQFVTLGAKKYCYTYIDKKSGKLKTETVTAGVKKGKGVKDIKQFKRGMVFEDATLKALYNDDDIEIRIGDRTVNVPPNVYLSPADYTLGLTEDYAALLLYTRGDEFEQIFYE